jgi:hypothetical protein
MHPVGLLESARHLARAWLRTFLGLALLITVAATGCGGSGQQPAGTATRTRATACGMAKTAADVPVRVEIVRGHLACARAMAVVRAYATAVRSGQAPGNGGGGPVKVTGWTCQGFATPVVLRTGKASKCVSSGREILEVLPPPPSSSSS